MTDFLFILLDLFYIFLIIAALVLLIYIYLLARRIILIKKLKSKGAGNMVFRRNIIASVFVPNGKPDMEFDFHGRKFSVCVITTPFKRVRYHFENENKLVIMIERKGIFVLKPAHPRPVMSASVERTYESIKYKMNFEQEQSGNAVRYVILHPAPHAVSKSEGTKYEILSNGDILYFDIRICGFKYFIENVLNGV